MSDQTDIERIIENQLSDLTLPCDMRDIRIRMAGAVQQCLAGKDAEIARLEEVEQHTLCILHRTEQENERLRARLAEAEKNYADVVDSNQHWHVRVEQLNAERDRYLERAEEAEARLAETQASYLPKVQEIISLTAKQLALESRCQRMRDALKYAEIGRGIKPAYDLVKEALAAPLDLELLNRVRETFRPFVQYPDELRDTDTISVTVTGDQMLSADQLLKSLSPAP